MSSLLSRSLPATLVYFRGRAAIRAQSVRRWFRHRGVAGVLRCLLGYPFRLLHRRRHEALIDQSLGVETRGSVGLWHLRVPFDSFRDATGYEASDPSLVRQILRDLRQDWSHFTFVDIGCGKGRALVIAAEFGFRRLIGIEFASQFAEIARENCRLLNLPAQILTQDALQFEFPSGDLVVYLYNPFNGNVLRPMLNRLLAADTQDCFIIYVNPVHRSLLDKCLRMKSVAGDSRAAVWRITPVSVSANPAAATKPLSGPSDRPFTGESLNPEANLPIA